MPAICLDDRYFSFPPVQAADEDGLLMIGGSISPGRIVEAYKKGIFPWYDDDSLPLWYSPDPRFVLFTNELHISRSLEKLLAKNKFEFRFNTAFERVIDACATTERKGQDGTWITPQIREVYTTLHHQGLAHSAETWLNGQLVGGIYGLQIGLVFFGESMFSHESNASKFAFACLVQKLKKEGVGLLDCQVHTEHVETLGAKLIPRDTYLTLLQDAIR